MVDGYFRFLCEVNTSDFAEGIPTGPTFSAGCEVRGNILRSLLNPYTFTLLHLYTFGIQTWLKITCERMITLCSKSQSGVTFVTCPLSLPQLLLLK